MSPLTKLSNGLYFTSVFTSFLFTARQRSCRKVMFLHLSVIRFMGRCVYDVTSCLAAWSHVPSVGWSAYWVRVCLLVGVVCLLDRGLPTRGYGIPLLLTSSGNHQSDQYASYWNTFFLIVMLSYSMCGRKSHNRIDS